jgi:hypothetical protein
MILLLAALGLQDVVVDADVPAGNVVVEKIDGDAVTLRTDLRDTEGPWFYWRFRVRGAQGRRLTFTFNGSYVSVRGPAVSLDGGATWAWHGRAPLKPSAFAFDFPAEARDVQFCVAVPYLGRDLKAFLKKHEGNPHLAARTLCASEKGREVERLHAGRLDGQARLRVLLTCRHHACEMMASYTMEGILEEVLTGEDDGRWLRENVEVLALPFMDKDGVEDGDQGKNRRGRDHNRDYKGESVYASVRALRDFVPAWSEGKLRLMLDLHCPSIRGAEHEVIHFVGQEDPKQWEAVQRFSALLEGRTSGPLKFAAKDNIPFGKFWNTPKNFKPGQRASAGWAAQLPGVALASTLEIPYANAAGATVTPDAARALGKDLARTIRRYLEEDVQRQPAR